MKIKLAAAVVFCCFAIPGRLPAQAMKPQTTREFECYIQAAEAKMAERQAFLVIDGDAALTQSAVRDLKVETVPGNGPNPHKISGAMVYDWIGTVFIPGVTGDLTIRLLQDYDHRPLYFPEIVAASRLLCRGGENRFGYAMRMKEPAVIDLESDVTWEHVDAHRWLCRSYSTKVQEVGKSHGYLLRLNSYWRVFESGRGVFVEGRSISLSGEFSSFMRTLGSIAGINPEKSLRKSLTATRESVGKPGLQVAAMPVGLPECGEAPKPAECSAR